MPRLFEKGHLKIGGMNKGDKHSLEARLKMSIAAKKRVIPEEQRARMTRSTPNRKRPLQGDKYRLLFRGKPNPKLKGSKCHFWKGGVTPENQLIRTSAPYAEWRRKVFERDNFTCQICLIKGGYLEADHIKPFSEHTELRFDLSNGRTLCKPCHKTTDTYAHKQRWKKQGIVKT